MIGGFVNSRRNAFKCSADCINLNSFYKHTRMGEGVFGVIYKVEDTENQKEFVAKISKKEILGN